MLVRISRFHLSHAVVALLCCVAVLLGTVPVSRADSLSFTGTLADPDSVWLQQFVVTSTSAVTLQSWSFGGGTHAAGQTIPSGGFLPDISVFGPAPWNPLLADTNFIYSCPPGNLDADNLCGDTTLLMTVDPGTYTFAVVAAPNFPLGPSLGDGFNGGGSFLGNYGANLTQDFAVDVSGAYVSAPSSAPVPEPATLLLFSSAIILVARKRKKR